LQEIDLDGYDYRWMRLRGEREGLSQT
jgi:hypothetical protein